MEEKKSMASPHTFDMYICFRKAAFSAKVYPCSNYSFIILHGHWTIDKIGFNRSLCGENSIPGVVLN